MVVVAGKLKCGLRAFRAKNERLFLVILTTSLFLFQITRASIDALKNWFRDEMQKSDWQLIMELKKTFEII